MRIRPLRKQASRRGRHHNSHNTPCPIHLDMSGGYNLPGDKLAPASEDSLSPGKSFLKVKKAPGKTTGSLLHFPFYSTQYWSI